MKGCVEFLSSSYNNANPPLIFLLELLQGTYYFQILLHAILIFRVVKWPNISAKEAEEVQFEGVNCGKDLIC